MKKKKKKRKVRILRVLAVILAAVLLVEAGVFLVRKLSEKVLTDSTIHIELDNAHGGDQSGVSGYITEDDFNDLVITKMAELLAEDSDFTVIRTHETGTAMNMVSKIEKINEDKPDMVFSLQCSWAVDESVSGMRIYAEKPSSKYNKKSLAFAQKISEVYTAAGYEAPVQYYYYTPIKDGNTYQEHIVPSDDMTDYGEETFTLMEKTEVPVVIASQMYVTSESDTQYWNNEEAAAQAAQLYCEAIRSYYDK